MSKKVFIILIASVLLIGGALTGFVAATHTPTYLAKTSLKSMDDAQKVTLEFTKYYYADDTYREMITYEKQSDGYEVNKKTIALSKDALSKNLFDATESKDFVNTLDLDFSFLKSANLKDAESKENDDGKVLFTASVKESKLEKIFNTDLSGVVAQNAVVEITHKNGKAESFCMDCIFDGDRFTLTIKFYYE